MKYAIVVTYTFNQGWLNKTWEERAAFERTHLRPIFAEYADRVAVRFFDAEAFSTRFSDFMLMETSDLRDYYFLIEALRESQLFKDGLAQFNDISVGIEDGFREYEAAALRPPLLEVQP
jgi:hypothetical protein